MTPEEVEVFARGLYYLANQDGIDQREIDLIVEFLQETGSELTIDMLKEDPSFDPLEATQVLQTTYLRRIFLKAAVALVKADGIYSDAERHALGDIADAFGISNAEFGDLEQEATGVDLQA